MIAMPFVRLAAAAACVLFTAGAASAQELVVNGGFETGLNGWSQSFSGGGCTIGASGDFAFGGSPTLSPSSGSFYGSLRQTGNLSGGCTLSQDVVLPSDGTITLNLDAGAIFGAQAADGSSINVQLQFSDSTDRLTAFLTSGTNAPMAPQPSIDLTPYVGRTATITVALSRNGRDLAGGVDRVSIFRVAPVPTMTEWAMVVLGLLVAATGVAAVRHRRI